MAAGVYSEKELDKRKEKMLFPSYKKATLGAVAYGNCLAVGNAQPLEQTTFWSTAWPSLPLETRWACGPNFERG
ncbi:MAG: hypothetical protein GY696_26640 [Gammaproteobacteria bacterium]|nr:hypothetical protein [Gammaproteobacteria bacterium]